jgi:hypothetical protein
VHTCRVVGLRMVGVPHCMVGGCVETGGKRKGTSELVRFLNDAVKPKLYYAYDRYADAYLRTPT